MHKLPSKMDKIAHKTATTPTESLCLSALSGFTTSFAYKSPIYATQVSHPQKPLYDRHCRSLWFAKKRQMTPSLIPAKKSDIFIVHIFCITDFQKNLYPCLCKPNFDPKKHSGYRATARPSCIWRTARATVALSQKGEKK